MFTLQQHLETTPAEAAKAFTEAEPFAAWFVAEGFETPADRVVFATDRIDAVFVGPDAEVPFTLHVTAQDLPRSIHLHFDEPAEDITVHLSETTNGTTLDYRSVGLTEEQEKSIKPGVATMLGHLATYFAR